jgi:hypothetical protein
MSSIKDRGFRALGSAGLALPTLVLLAGLQPASAQQVTWASDVAPIVYNSCVECHQPEGIAPMSLLDYQTARRYARRMEAKVSAREMPPWHVDKDVGIQGFKNDVSLSDNEIRTIVQWAEDGAPQGDMSKAPSVPDLPKGDEWRLAQQFGRPPDLIIRSTPYDVPVSGLDNWWTPEVVVQGLDEPRWVMANETKPTYPLGRQTVHHANTNLVQDGESSGFSNFGVGKPYDIYPDNTGRLVKPGDKLEFNIHYRPNGHDAVTGDVVEVGLWFYPKGEVPRFHAAVDVQWSSQAEVMVDGQRETLQQLVLPPHGRLVTQGTRVLNENTRIQSCRGHMHMHGSAQQLEAIMPDGQREIICKVNWNGLWHITYLFDDDKMPLLPKGTVLLITAWYDNTENNPVNPDPDQWVVFGRRSADEMSHMWIGVTYLSDEDFQFLKDQRAMRVAQAAQQ